MSLYKLPLGIRIPKNNEYPDGYDVKSINEERSSAEIIEGFKIDEVSGEKFSCFAEINIDANKIWDVFYHLTNKLIGDVAYGILGFKGEEPILSKFTEKETLLKIFEKFKFELANDGYLEFGIAYYDENILNEIYVTSFKYMRIWTVKKGALIESLNSFGIRHYSKVIEFIEGEFKKL